MANFNWHGEECLERIHKEEERRMQITTRYVKNQVVKKLGQKYPPASSRGEPPALRTGQLRRSIATEVVRVGQGVIGRVGTNLYYAKYLELEQYLGRSFLAVTVQEEQTKINALLQGNPI